MSPMATVNVLKLLKQTLSDKLKMFRKEIHLNRKYNLTIRIEFHPFTKLRGA